MALPDPKDISSSYVVVTKEANVDTLRGWLNARQCVASKSLKVKTLEEMNRVSGWQYVNKKGVCYSVGKPERGKHYYYVTFGPQQPAAEEEVKPKQLRLQNSMIESHFQNDEGHVVCPAELFLDGRPLPLSDNESDSEEEVKDPGPYKLRYTLNSKKKDLLDVLYKVIDERDTLRREVTQLKTRLEEYEPVNTITRTRRQANSRRPF